MWKSNWRIFKCTKCNREIIHYGYDKDEEKEKETCLICAGKAKEITREEANVQTLCELLGDMFEDNNYHGFTRIGSYFVELMKKVNISEREQKKVILAFIEDYEDGDFMFY